MNWKATMRTRRSALPATTRMQLIQCAILAEAVGVVILAISLFISMPLLLILCIPIGAGLTLIGALVWAWAFIWAT